MYPMKVLKFQNEYYKKCEENEVSITDEIVIIKKKEIPVETYTIFQDGIRNILEVVVLLILM